MSTLRRRLQDARATDQLLNLASDYADELVMPRECTQMVEFFYVYPGLRHLILRMILLYYDPHCSSKLLN